MHNYISGDEENTGVFGDVGTDKKLKFGTEGNRKSVGGKNHVTINIDNLQDADPPMDPTFVEAYMKFMYWICVSPFNPASIPVACDATSCLDLGLSVIRKVI